jgi:benzylsuccinate CoA-transferase BbsF subunit
MGQALEGINVLDFGWVLVGSLTGKYLGDHGAQVIRVESASRPDLTRANQLVSISKRNNPDDKPWFNYLNTSKYGFMLDLKHPRAHEVLDKLIQWADVVNANFTPGTLDKLGFGYEYMRKIKPDIIMAEESIYGQTSSLAKLGGGDPTGAALSGYLDLTGWPDRGPVVPNPPYGDALLPLLIATAIVAAVDYRRRTGKGQYIDTSMFEVCAQQITPALLDVQANSHIQTRNGNRIDYASPHGAFPCLGDDRWIAIAVFNDDEWKAFCHVIGDPAWTKDAKFATLGSRKENEDDLENLIAEWTRTRRAEDIMQIMQSAGVPAGVVQNAQDLLDFDPQLKERDFLVPLKHSVLGEFGHPTPPFKLLKTKAQMRTSPCLGEHTEYVCTKLLNMSDEYFIELIQEGVFS